MEDTIHNRHPCPVDGCDKAYPHSLLTDYHVVQEHEEWLDDIIQGNNTISLD